MQRANFGAAYCALYPELAEIARSHGYALAIHGSMARDFDLICIPWVDLPSEPQAVVDNITSAFSIRAVGGLHYDKPHGRITQTLSIGFGECAIDLSFMPIVRAAPGFLIARADCTCSCHTDPQIKHISACCYNPIEGQP